MTRIAPKFALALQTASGILIVLLGLFTLIAVSSDAQKQAGPPYYLLAEVLVIVISGLLCLSAMLLWVWKRPGWWLSICLDGALALFSAYLVGTDLICRSMTSLGFDIFFGVTFFFFGTIAALLASRQSRAFFQLSVPPILASV